MAEKKSQFLDVLHQLDTAVQVMERTKAQYDTLAAQADAALQEYAHNATVVTKLQEDLQTLTSALMPNATARSRVRVA